MNAACDFVKGGEGGEVVNTKPMSGSIDLFKVDRKLIPVDLGGKVEVGYYQVCGC